MKITPLDIQQQQFRVRFRGFDMVEVDNFLDLVANEVEELLKENNQLKEEDRRKLAKISELESSQKDVREALISAQRIVEQMKNNAMKEGELIIEDAKVNARKIIDSAQTQAIQTEEEINRLRKQRAQFEASLKAIIDMHWKMLASSQENAEEVPG